MTISSPEPADPITELYTALVDDFRTSLDLAAGAADATQPHHFTRLTADLKDLLDVDAGLTAIVGPLVPHPPPAPARVQPSPPRPASWVIPLADMLSQLAPPTRLQLRSTPASAGLSNSLDLAEALTFDDAVGELYSALAEAPTDEDLTESIELVRELLGRLDQARNLDHAYALQRGLARDPALAVALTSARLLAGALADDLHRYRRRIDRGRALPSDRAAVHASAAELNRGLGRVQAGIRTLTREAGFAIAAILGQDLRSTADQPATAAELRYLRRVADQVTNDFTTADLRSVPLDEIWLEKVRWSAATRWPPGWEKPVRANSDEIASGIFEIRGGGRDRSNLGAP